MSGGNKSATGDGIFYFGADNKHRVILNYSTANNFSASSAAIHPVPAAVIA